MQDAPRKEDLVNQGISRVRALLASRVGELRVARDWNWRDLACAAGMNAKQVEDVEKGARDPAFTTVVKLANGLGVRSIDELLGPLPLEATREAP